MIILFWGTYFLCLPPYNSKFQFFEIKPGLRINVIRLYLSHLQARAIGIHLVCR